LKDKSGGGGRNGRFQEYRLGISGREGCQNAEVNAVSGIRFRADGANVRFGSKADIRPAHVRFGSKADAFTHRKQGGVSGLAGATQRFKCTARAVRTGGPKRTSHAINIQSARPGGIASYAKRRLGEEVKALEASRAITAK